MFKKRKKRTAVEINVIKNKITELWGKIYYNPITTKEFFEKLGKDYYNISERENIYRYNRECQMKAEDLWEQFEIIEGDKEVIFKKWMDHCWLNKIPYIILEDGIASTPKNYFMWQKILNKICLKKIFGTRKAMVRMASKDMELQGIPVRSLLPEYNEFINLLPKDIEGEEIKEEMLEYKNNKVVKTTEEIKENDVNNEEIKEFASKLEQKIQELEKMKMELTKKFLKNKIEDNEEK